MHSVQFKTQMERCSYIDDSIHRLNLFMFYLSAIKSDYLRKKSSIISCQVLYSMLSNLFLHFDGTFFCFQ